MDGYICLYRKMLDWQWMQEPLTAHLFTCLLLLANQEEGWLYKGLQLHAGQLVTSYDRLAEVSGLTPKEVRMRMSRLQRSGELELVSTRQGTLVTIVNYSCYQFEQNGSVGKQMGKRLGKRQNTASGSTQEPNEEAGTILGKRLGKRLGKQDESEPKTQNSTENLGKRLGKRLGKQNEPTTATPSEPNTDQQQVLGKQMGKQMGTYQYSIFNQDIITEKKNKKESTEPNVAYTTSELEQLFEDFRKAYKGTKRGFKVEFGYFKKKHQQDWKEIVPQLMPALERMEAWRAQQQAAGMFVPQYAMLQTWLNQSRWTTEYEINTTSNGTTEITAGAGEDIQPVPNYEEEF